MCVSVATRPLSSEHVRGWSLGVVVVAVFFVEQHALHVNSRGRFDFDFQRQGHIFSSLFYPLLSGPGRRLLRWSNNIRFRTKPRSCTSCIHLYFTHPFTFPGCTAPTISPRHPLSPSPTDPILIVGLVVLYLTRDVPLIVGGGVPMQRKGSTVPSVCFPFSFSFPRTEPSPPFLVV